MLALVQSSSKGSAQQATAPIEVGGSCSAAFDQIAHAGTRLEMAPGEMLFRENEPKQAIFRVESGALCLFRDDVGDGSAALGFAFRGDYLGLGALERHVWSAVASVPAMLTRLPLGAAAKVVDSLPSARVRQDEDTALEFSVLRDRLVAQGRENVAIQLAALLLALASMNEGEGRERNLVSDDLSSGAAAELLGIDVAELESALVRLSRQGFIRAEPQGALRIVDRSGLERYAALEAKSAS